MLQYHTLLHTYPLTCYFASATLLYMDIVCCTLDLLWLMSATWYAAHWLSPSIHHLWPAVANGGRQSMWTAVDSTITNVVFVISATWFHTGWSPKGLSLHQLHMIYAHGWWCMTFLCILDMVLCLVDVSCLRLYEILWCLNIRMQCHKGRFWFLSMAVVVEQLVFFVFASHMAVCCTRDVHSGLWCCKLQNHRPAHRCRWHKVFTTACDVNPSKYSTFFFYIIFLYIFFLMHA